MFGAKVMPWPWSRVVVVVFLGRLRQILHLRICLAVEVWSLGVEIVSVHVQEVLRLFDVFLLLFRQILHLQPSLAMQLCCLDVESYH
jgi:hypothetical protein